MKNISKLIVSKPMKHGKNKDNLFFLLSFTKCQHEKIIENTFFVSAGSQKGWETAGSGTTLAQYLPNIKNKIPAKSTFHKLYLSYFQLVK